MELTPENAKGFTTLHPRCGTSFLLIVMLISIIVFSCMDFILPVPVNGIPAVFHSRYDSDGTGFLFHPGC